MCHVFFDRNTRPRPNACFARHTFLNIFLRIFEAIFPTQTEKSMFENDEWVAKGIKTSCKHK
jgi:hypothetical protein